jgi:serine/threonine-protein kinase
MHFGENKLRSWRFDNVIVDGASFRIMVDGEPRAIEPKSFRLLQFLIEERDRAVSKDEILQAVWGGTFVSDNALTRAIAQIRKVIEDDHKQPRYIETIPTVGYRFLAQVTEWQNPDAELEPVRSAASPKASNELRERHRRARTAFLALLIVFAGALGVTVGWWMFDKRESTSPDVQPLVRFTSPYVPASRPTEWDRPVLTVAPDGSAIAYVGKGASRPQLYVRKMERLDASLVPGSEDASNPFFSPDGKWVAFFAYGKLKKASVVDLVIQTLCDVPNPFNSYGGVWGPDNIIVFGGSVLLMKVSADGGAPERLTKFAPGELSHRWPSLSPDARTLVYTTSNSAGPALEEPQIVAYSLDSGKREVLPVEASYASFAPGGKLLLLVRNGVLLAAPFDPILLKTTGSPVLVLEGMMQSSTGAAQFSSSLSAMVYLQGAAETRRLVWVDRTGKVEPLDAPARPYVHPRLSPDGQKIAVGIIEPKNDIWIYDIPRSVLSRLTMEGSNAYPIWAPDGKKIAYVSSRQGHPPNVFWKPADGSGADERLLTSEYRQVTESWLPDGKSLVFVELRPNTTNWDIRRLSLADAREPEDVQATPFLDGTPQISPSGRYLAYNSTESGKQEVHVRSFPGTGFKVQVSQGGGSGESSWRRDERELYYRQGQAMMVASVNSEPHFSIGKPTVLFRGQFARIQGKNYDVTPDGQRFLMVLVDGLVPPNDITVVWGWMEDLKSRLQ